MNSTKDYRLLPKRHFLGAVFDSRCRQTQQQIQLAAERVMFSEAERVTFSGWKYSHYFAFIEEIRKNIKVNCKLGPNEILSTGKDNTLNLSKVSAEKQSWKLAKNPL